MEIIQVPTPSFDYEGERLYVHASRWINLKAFQDEIDRKQQLGVTKCFFYTLYTQYDPNYPKPEHIIYWVRCLFYKSKLNDKQ